MNYELLVLTRRKKRKSFNHVYNFCPVLTLVLYASMSYLGWNRIFEISNTSWLTGHMINCILNECGRAERESIIALLVITALGPNVMTVSQIFSYPALLISL